MSAAAGDSLSVKAVRLAVQAATGWSLDSAKLRAVVRDSCAEYLEQQQQKQQQQAEQQQQEQQQKEGEGGEPHQGVSEAAVTKAVHKLLEKGELSLCSAGLARNLLPHAPAGGLVCADRPEATNNTFFPSGTQCLCSALVSTALPTVYS